VIYKPRPEISVFAGYNRVGGALPLSTSAGEFPTDSFRVGVGDQREVGIKTSWWQDRLAVSAAFFDIVQDNVQVTNPAWRTDPRGEPRYLFYDLLNRGWEVEASGLVTPSLELVGNFTHMHMRDTFGAPQLMVPDAAGALFAHYTIRQGRWKGIGASVGLDHVGRQPGSTLEGIPSIEGGAEFAVHLGEQDGVAAQLKEIVRDAYHLGLQRLGPDGRNGALQIGLRRRSLRRRHLGLAPPHRLQLAPGTVTDPKPCWGTSVMPR
jgi:hypothetical protein